MKPQEALDFLESKMELVFTAEEGVTSAADLNSTSVKSSVKPIKCTSFKTLIQRTRKAGLEVTFATKATFAVMLATEISVLLRQEPLWVFVVGPGSSGKTTLAECLAIDKKRTKLYSKFIGLVSGMKDKSGKDYGIINSINGKTVILKDYTSVLTMSEPDQKRIEGELREAYDGKMVVEYRNGEKRAYDNINFSLIACVTDAINKRNTTELGERFFRIDIIDQSHEPEKLASTAFSNSEKTLSLGLRDGTPMVVQKMHEARLCNAISEEKKFRLQRSTLGFMDHIHDYLASGQAVLPFIEDDAKTAIEALGRLITYARGKITLNKEGDVAHETRNEYSPRIVIQLQKLTTALGVIFDESHITKDSESFAVVKKVATDTGKGNNFLMIQAVGNSKLGLNAKQIAFKLGIGESTAKRYLKNLLMRNIITKTETPNNSNISGRKTHKYLLTKRLRRYWHQSGL